MSKLTKTQTAFAWLWAISGIALTARGVLNAEAGPARKPNELGQIMILEYHKIGYPEARWARTPENFERDLETLYRKGYRLQNMNDVIDGRITVPAGTTPVVLTFDDGGPGQFGFAGDPRDGKVDPRSAVGIIEAFAEAHPDMGRAGTFYVNPSGPTGDMLFAGKAPSKLAMEWLVSHGYEIGNHTMSHPQLSKLDQAGVEKEIGGLEAWVQRRLPGYKMRSIALPFGIYPQQDAWAAEGSYRGTRYRNEALLMVGSGPIPSPFSVAYKPWRLPRIQAFDEELNRWYSNMEAPGTNRYVSDGDPAVVTVPVARKAQLRSNLGSLKVRIE